MMAYRERVIANWQNAIRTFVEDRRAGTAMTVGLLSPLVIGAAGLGVDAAFWQLTRQQMQTTADIAAVAGAVELVQGGDEATIKNAVVAELLRNGFPAKADGNAPNVNVSVASASGGNAKPQVQVELQMSGDLYFSGFFLSDPPRLTADSIAGLRQDGSGGEVCVLGLDETMSANLSFQGTPDVKAGCAMASNSTADDAIQAGGNASVDASSLLAAGGFDFGSNTTIVADTLLPYFGRLADPYGPRGRNLQPPLASTCDFDGKTTVNNDQTLQPGRYCGDLEISNANVTFEPGLYIIDAGDFKTRGNSSLSGEGVTFVLTATSPGDVGVLDFTGGTDVQLSAPDDSEFWAASLGYQGVLFYVDQNASSMKDNNYIINKLQGGSSAVLRGAVYVPSRALRYTGGAVVDAGCLQLIAAQILFQGNAAFKLDPETCDLVGADPVGAISIAVLG